VLGWDAGHRLPEVLVCCGGMFGVCVKVRRPIPERPNPNSLFS